MPATVSHALSMTTPDDPAYENQPKHWNSSHAFTLNASGSEISGAFSNAVGGVSFGLDGGGYVTASAPAAAPSPINFSAGTTSGDLGSVVFSNSNGVSFGLNGSTITGSHNGLTTAMASNRGSDFVQATAAFAGTSASGTIASNGISVSIGPYITTAMASNAATISNIKVSAGTSSTNLSALTFDNSNGISFGLNGSVITGSHNALTSQSNQAVSNSAGSFTFQTLNFSNANNVTFGTSAGGIVTASVANPSGITNIKLSAGTSSANLSDVTFSNSNGVSFGLNGSTLTASCLPATLSMLNPNNVFYDNIYSNLGTRNLVMQPVVIPQFLTATAGVVAFSVTMTTHAASSWSCNLSVSLALYTRNVSTLGMASSGSTAYAIRDNSGGSTASISGNRFATLTINVSATPGNYWVAFIMDTATTNSNGVAFSNAIWRQPGNAWQGLLGAANNATNQMPLGLGVYSTTVTSFPANVAFSELTGTHQGSIRAPMFNLINVTA